MAGWRVTLEVGIIVELKCIVDQAKASDLAERLSIKDASFMQITRSIMRQKGKWKRVPDDV